GHGKRAAVAASRRRHGGRAGRRRGPGLGHTPERATLGGGSTPPSQEPLPRGGRRPGGGAGRLLPAPDASGRPGLLRTDAAGAGPGPGRAAAQGAQPPAVIRSSYAGHDAARTLSGLRPQRDVRLRPVAFPQVGLLSSAAKLGRRLGP
ncbi:unnamed protein product, partial [Ixodes pacificus]